MAAPETVPSCLANRSLPCRGLYHRELRVSLGLVLKEVDDSRDRVELELLVRVELEFHNARSHGLEARHTVCSESLDRIRFQLVVSCEALIQAHDALRFPLSHGAYHF